MRNNKVRVYYIKEYSTTRWKGTRLSGRDKGDISRTERYLRSRGRAFAKREHCFLWIAIQKCRHGHHAAESLAAFVKKMKQLLQSDHLFACLVGSLVFPTVPFKPLPEKICNEDNVREMDDESESNTQMVATSRWISRFWSFLNIMVSFNSSFYLLHKSWMHIFTRKCSSQPCATRYRQLLETYYSAAT